MMLPVALTIAGSDPSGGAGIQADLKTFHQHRVYGTTVITLLTVQNSRHVSDVRVMAAPLVREQLRAVLEDIPPTAAKTGALGSLEIIETLAEMASSFSFPLVIDPVMISKHGAPLMPIEAMHALRDQLLPYATLATPNLHEAASLAGMKTIDSPDQMEDAARLIAQQGASHVLVKGGHLDGDAVDVLFTDGQVHEFRAPRIHTRHTHGTGCTLSAAITAHLARGRTLVESVQRAKRFLTSAIETAPGLGQGHGPTNHFAPIDD